MGNSVQMQGRDTHRNLSPGRNLLNTGSTWREDLGENVKINFRKRLIGEITPFHRGHVLLKKIFLLRPERSTESVDKKKKSMTASRSRTLEKKETARTKVRTIAFGGGSTRGRRREGIQHKSQRTKDLREDPCL